ncbi:MAG: LWR-salt protein [Haloplanus sp.]
MASYVFRVRFRLDLAGVSADPETFETVVRKPAPTPGDPGWLFFRDELWRGEVGDEAHLRSLAETWLSVPVVSVSFSELVADESYLSALRDAIETHPEAFDGDAPRAVIHRHLGSSIRVT